MLKITLEDGSERLLLGGLAGEEEPVTPVEEQAPAAPKRMESEREDAKPWITRDESIAPTPVRRFLNSRDQFIAAQSGLNPRRGRSLSEVIDEQWRKSRVDQLGHPVPAQAVGRPMESPIDRAMEAIAEAWRIRDARANLLNQLVGVAEIREALKDYFAGDAISGETAAFEAALNEFEANRLKLAMEIDELRAQREELFEKLMVEVRSRNASEVAALDRQREAAAAELERLTAEVASLEERAKSAEASLNALFGEKFDERISAKIFEDRTLSRLLSEKGAQLTEPAQPPLKEIDRDALVDRVDIRLKRMGFFLTREEVINLLMLAGLGDAIVLSGAPGSGHTAFAEAFADSIGARYERADSATFFPQSAGSFVQFDDVNLRQGAETSSAALSLSRRLEGRNAIFAVVNDIPDGSAVSQKMLCASYFVRLRPPTVNAPWRDYKPAGESDGAVSMEALKNAFKPVEEIPTHMEMKLFDIRTALLGSGYLVGRDILVGLWRYCAVGINHLGVPPAEVLDFALAQRALPAIMASMEPRVLRALPSIFADMPRCKALMGERVPVF